MKPSTVLRIQQLFILIVHLILLYWMIWALKNSGDLTMTAVFLHFAGMSLLGGLTIRGTAWWANYHWQKEKLKEKSS